VLILVLPFVEPPSLSQDFEGGHFRKSEISSENLLHQRWSSGAAPDNCLDSLPVALT
jgi:hypothetical protein